MKRVLYIISWMFTVYCNFKVANVPRKQKGRACIQPTWFQLSNCGLCVCTYERKRQIKRVFPLTTTVLAVQNTLKADSLSLQNSSTTYSPGLSVFSQAVLVPGQRLASVPLIIPASGLAFLFNCQPVGAHASVNSLTSAIVPNREWARMSETPGERPVLRDV